MNKLNIPTKIKVGYQKREGTYTKQLAYVIYYDEKGKLRKETSWESWRHKDIEPQEFTNEPTSGFVLNKGVGGARNSWGWNPRNEYVRVFDPRGHEFEISVANLLFILQECNSIKGKGLEGEFVYAWDGTELVLLPTNCYEYESSKDFTSLKSMKVTKKDMVEGCNYLHKNTETYMYLGRILCREPEKGSWNELKNIHKYPTEKRHIFYNEKTKEYLFEKGFTKFAKRLTIECSDTFANNYTDFINSKYVSKAKELHLQEINLPTTTYSNYFLVKVNTDSYALVRKYYTHYRRKLNKVVTEIVYSKKDLKDPKKMNNFLDRNNLNPHYTNINISEKELKEIYPNNKFYTIELELESGIKLGVDHFEKRQ